VNPYEKTCCLADVLSDPGIKLNVYLSGGKLTKQEILDYLNKKVEEKRIARFWILDIVEIASAFRKQGGGFDKKAIGKNERGIKRTAKGRSSLLTSIHV